MESEIPACCKYPKDGGSSLPYPIGRREVRAMYELLPDAKATIQGLSTNAQA